MFSYGIIILSGIMTLLGDSIVEEFKKLEIELAKKILELKKEAA